MKTSKLRIRTTGQSVELDEEYIDVTSLLSRCGDIENGVGIKLGSHRAGFVVDFNDLERAYKQAARARGLPV